MEFEKEKVIRELDRLDQDDMEELVKNSSATTSIW